MANAVATDFDKVISWFKSIWKKLPSWTVVAQTSLNLAAIAFEGVTAAVDPALATVADPTIQEIQTKFGTLAGLIKAGNGVTAAQILPTIEADLSQLESVANISDTKTKAEIAGIVATLNAVLASIPVGA